MIEDLAGGRFAAARGTVAGGRAAWTAGFVHFRDHAGFEQRARGSERDFMGALVFKTVVEPIAFWLFVHVTDSAFETRYRQGALHLFHVLPVSAAKLIGPKNEQIADSAEPEDLLIKWC